MGRFGPQERVQFLELKALCYRGLESDDLLAAIGQRLADATHADATCLLELDPETALPIYAVSQGWSAENHRPLIEHALLASPTADPGRLIEQGTRTAVVDDLLPDRDRYYHDPYFEFHLLLGGYRHEVQTVCTIRNRGQALLTITRREEAGAFEPRYMRLIDAIAPHVAAGVYAANVRKLLDAPVATRTGFIVLNESGEVSLANDVGERWLATTVMHESPRRPWVLEVLNTLLARSLSEEGAGLIPAIEVADPVNGALHRLRAEQSTSANGDPCTIILIEPVQRIDRAEPLLRFGLTPREAEITLELLRGKDVGTIAREAAVSRHTVIQHLRNVFTKLDVSSRRDLMLRLYGGF